jgi:hypothetical protein
MESNILNLNLTEDFMFIVNTINSTHPLAISGLPCDFVEYVNNNYNKANSKGELIAVLSRLTALLYDGHTNIEVEYSLDDSCINLPCKWLNDGLYVYKNYHELLAGDKIIAIGNLTTEDVLNSLCEIIPHENNYLVKMRATTYPFLNYHIFSELVLRYIGALNEAAVQITVLRENQPLTFYFTLEKYNGFLNFKDTERFVDFWIEDDVAILKLDECKYNDEYRRVLCNFFRTVKERSIRHIILNLRENMGGGSRVANEFLRYISISSYYYYGIKMRKQNENKLININLENNLITNIKAEMDYIFHGNIACLVSNKTFSSARIFATVLKDNNIATIIGEPTGGKPCSYGNPLRFETPNFKIKFRVSSRIFTRPCSRGIDDMALFPDIPIYPTIKDFINKEDVVLSRAIDFVKEMKF